MANKKGSSLLMVWGEMPAEKEEDFNRWYKEEHLLDLLRLPGVLSAARYEAVSGGPKHLACYEMEGPEVFESAEWKRYQDNPTDWTKRIAYRETATAFVNNRFTMIHPAQVTSEIAQADMAPFLQIGRMDVPTDIEDKFNEWYNTIYVPNYEKVAGCIRARRFQAFQGEPKYLVVYEFEHEKVSQSPEWLTARESSPVTATIRPHMKHSPGSPGIWKKTFQP